MPIQTTAHQLSQIYETSQRKLKKARQSVARQSVARQGLKTAFTLSEKILFSHLNQLPQERGQDSLSLQPDRVAMQDVTAQMALLQFMLADQEQSAVPATVHCDHLIQAYRGAGPDTEKSYQENSEVFQFLSSTASRFNIGFWKPGAGIIHQVILENYAFPGGLLIGTDSHTPNAGGLGMLAIGVGGADSAEVMAGMPWELSYPGIIGVHLKGQLKGWASPKDIILKLLSILTVKGGTNKIIEYFGEGASSLSCTGKATIANMGAELGATSSLFPYDLSMSDYLKATDRSALVPVIEKHKELFRADEEVLQNPHGFYNEVIEIDLSALEPQIAGPHSPDAVHSLSEMKKLCEQEGWPARLSSALIGSCTNSSYEDIGRSAHIARQARAVGLKMPQPFLVTPGSELIRQTIERDGYIKDFTDIGALVLANACGPCIGQWRRDEYKKGQVNTILNSFNRNFRGRNDANPKTLSFIASPEITVALGLAGRLDFNPQTDSVDSSKGPVKLEPPRADIFPQKGFLLDKEGYQAPRGKTTTVVIKSTSERLQVIKPFPPYNKEHFKNLLVLCKTKGKCTTDHISPAGFWLRYRGHLDRISDNLLLGAVNAWTEETGQGTNQLTGERGQAFSKIARFYKARKRHWLIIGGENYGEGSSREHAAMTPRYLGCSAVIVLSFARIHESNLKKQGVLPLCFVQAKDRDKIQEGDTIDILDLEELAPNSQHKVLITHKDGKREAFLVSHSLSENQIKWFRAGSALNLIRP